MSINFDLQIHCSWFKYQDFCIQMMKGELIWAASLKMDHIFVHIFCSYFNETLVRHP